MVTTTDELRKELEKNPLVRQIRKQRGTHGGYKVTLTGDFFILPSHKGRAHSVYADRVEYFPSRLSDLKDFLENGITQDLEVLRRAEATKNEEAARIRLEKEKERRGSFNYVMSDKATEKFPLVRKYMLAGASPFARLLPTICDNNSFATITSTIFDVEDWQISAVKTLEKKIAELGELRGAILDMDVKATEEFLQGVQKYCSNYIEKGDEA